MHLQSFTGELGLIPQGPPGIEATLRTMKALALEGKKNIRVRTKAASLVQGCGDRDYYCELVKLHAFVRDEIRYLRDVDGVETVQAPDVTLEMRAGDCDDQTTLLVALLLSVGFSSSTLRFMAIGFAPSVFEHVYAEAKIGQRWVPLETTEPVNIGWSPEEATGFPVMARMPFWI